VGIQWKFVNFTTPFVGLTIATGAVSVAPSCQDKQALMRDLLESAKAQHIQAHRILHVLSVKGTVKMQGNSVIEMSMAWRYVTGSAPIV
jgi:hypothetical protein